MFSFPSHLMAGRSAIEKARSVPGPVMRTLSVRSMSATSASIARDMLE
jgi:hypothetical protein